MKNKKIVSLVASLAMLTSVSGVTAFAGNLLSEKKAETPEIVADEEAPEAAEEEAEAQEEEAAEEETAAEDVTAEEEAAVVLEEIAEDVPEVIAETLEDIQPAKPIDKRVILAKIDEVFDLEKQDFKDEAAKAEWFAFCEELKASEPEKNAEGPVAPPAPIEGEGPVAPPAPVEGEGPVAPPAPVEGEGPVAPPAPVEGEGPVAPPAPVEGEGPVAPPAPIHDEDKPEPPAGPAAHHGPAAETETEADSAEAE